jgi:hypothetical protein
VRGSPPSESPRWLTSNTHTSARPTPGVVSCGSRPVFCPRCAVVIKARWRSGPANTMSRGSSPTSRVRTTRPRGPSPRRRSTMLTLSERWFTTHTSVFERAATATGSRPTGMESTCFSPRLPIRKISRRLSGVLTAKRCMPSGDSASGRTWPLSNSVNDDSERVGVTDITPKSAAAARMMPRTGRQKTIDRILIPSTHHETGTRGLTASQAVIPPCTRPNK